MLQLFRMKLLTLDNFKYVLFFPSRKMAKLSIGEGGQKVDVVGVTMPKVDHALVAKGLGAEYSLLLRQLTKEEAQEYEPIGGLYLMEAADELMIRRNAGSMLAVLGKSIDDVVGYRVLDLKEEQEFRKRCAEEKKDPSYLHMPLVRYYAKKEDK